jgi:hypothetical protein
VKGVSWLVPGAVLLVGLAVVGFQAGYGVGSDIARSENAARGAQ